MSGNTLRSGNGSRPTDAWTVQTTEDRSAWADERVTCPHCGGGVALDGPHVGVQLVRSAGTRPADRKRTLDHRTLAFCDRDCATAWLDARANGDGRTVEE